MIKPFRDRIISISKIGLMYQHISIAIDDPYDKELGICIMNLPRFPANEMYQNMETGKDYTLEDLGL